MSTIARRAYYAAVSLTWVLLGCLALETCEAGRALFADRFYQRYYDAQSKRFFRMAQDGQATQGVPAVTLPQSRSSQQTAPQRSDAPITDAAIREARAAYAESSPERRNGIAALEGRVVITFDAAGRYQSSYGNPYTEQRLRDYLLMGNVSGIPPELAQATAAAQRGQPQQPCEFTWDTFGVARTYEVTIATPNGGGTELVIRDVTEARTHEPPLTAAPPPEDSAWEIVCYRYKKNWGDPKDPMRINNIGFRGPDAAIPKPQGRYRIICIGGSTTEEVDHRRKSYPRLVEEKLQARFGADAVDVLNCGVCGMDSFKELSRLEEYLALDPDLIVYYEAVNDLTASHFELWRDRASTWQKILRRSRFLNRYLNRWLLPSEAAMAAHLEATTFRNIQALRYGAQERNVDMAICSFVYPRLHAWNLAVRSFLDMNLRRDWRGRFVTFRSYCRIVNLYNRMARALCEREGLLYIPVAENFPVDPDYFVDLCHMTDYGIELKARVVAAYVADHLERNPRFKSTAPP